MEAQISAKTVTWTNLLQPEPAELATFIREAQLLPSDAEFIVQNYHRPEITIRPHYILILLHIPIFNKQRRVTTTASLFLVIREGQIWTLQYEEIIVLTKLWQEMSQSEDKREEYFGEGAGSLALHVINVLFAGALAKLERLNQHINIAEDAVFQGNERKMVEEVAILIRDVMDFRKVIRPQRQLFATPPSHPLITNELHDQWLRLHRQVNKLWDLLESLTESVSQLGKTNNTLLQHKENELLRLLTYYSILSIPVLVLMNPLNPTLTENSPLTDFFYWCLLGALLLLLIVIFARFRGKRVL